MQALKWARIALGLVCLLRTTALVRFLPGVHLLPTGWLVGWPENGAHPVAFLDLVLPTWVTMIACVVRTIAILAFTLGVRVRISGIALALSGYVVISQDPFAFLFTMHVMLLGVLVLSMSDERSPMSSLLLARIFVASIYLWSAIPKLSGAWLSGNVLSVVYFEMGYGHNALGTFLLRDHAQLCACGAVLLELALPVLLLVNRTRPIALAVACAMHVVFEMTLHPDAFGFVMIALLVVFIDAGDREGRLTGSPLGRIINHA